jgi:hypothetical protein
MANEICVKCGDVCTPWYFDSVLKGHICMDCYYDGYEEME